MHIIMKPMSSIILFLLLSTSSFGTLIDVQFDKNPDSSSLGGIARVSDATGATLGPVAAISFTVTNLTIDSVGTLDDSIAFEFTLTGTGSDATAPTNHLGFGANSGRWGVNSAGGGDTASFLDAAGESITLVLSDSTVTLGAGATEMATITFIGFTGFDLANFTGNGGDLFNLSGTSADGMGLGTAADPTTFDPTPSFTLEHNAGSFRLANITATFDASVIPEPSAPALVGIGVLTLMVSRRKC